MKAIALSSFSKYFNTLHPACLRPAVLLVAAGVSSCGVQGVNMGALSGSELITRAETQTSIPDIGAAMAALSVESGEVAYSSSSPDASEGEASSIELGMARPQAPVDERITAFQLIAKHPDLSAFAMAIQSSSLRDVFDDKNQKVTIFAPSDEAFSQYSNAQQSRLLADNDKLRRMLQIHVAKDVQLTPGAIRLVDTVIAADGNTYGIERAGYKVVLTHNNGTLEVRDTLMKNEFVIHIIDDFIDMPTDLFTPDEGTLAARLKTIEANEYSSNPFAEFLSQSRWYGWLGNAERHWTVMLPTRDSERNIEWTDLWENIDSDPDSKLMYSLQPDSWYMGGLTEESALIADHIIEHTSAPSVSISPGRAIAASGREIIVGHRENRYSAAGQDILEPSFINASNATVHKLRTPITAVRTNANNAPSQSASILTALELKTGSNDEFGGPLTSRYDQAELTAALFRQLILETGQESIYNDPEQRLTLLLPDQQISEQPSTNEGNNCPFSAYETAIIRFYNASQNSYYSEGYGDTGSILIPDVFPNMNTALKYLYDHTLVNAHSASILNNALGNAVMSLSGNAYPISGEYVTGYNTDGSSYEWGPFPRLVQQSFHQLAAVSNGSIMQVSGEIARIGDNPGAPLECDEQGRLLGPEERAMNDANLNIYRRAIHNMYGDFITFSQKGYTVFAPTDSTLKNLGNESADSAMLVDHLVTFRSISPSELKQFSELTTHSGRKLTVIHDARTGITTIDGMQVTFVTLANGTNIYALGNVSN